MMQPTPEELEALVSLRLLGVHCMEMGFSSEDGKGCYEEIECKDAKYGTVVPPDWKSLTLVRRFMERILDYTSEVDFRDKCRGVIVIRLQDEIEVNLYVEALIWTTILDEVKKIEVSEAELHKYAKNLFKSESPPKPNSGD